MTDPYDAAQAQSWDFDVLWNNAGQGEAGPVWEIPVDLVRRNYEMNVFLPLALTQRVVQKWVANKKKGKVANETMADSPFRWLDDQLDAWNNQI